jgi:hypothetical protein
MEKFEEIKDRPKAVKIELYEDDLKFILRKAELHKELLAFWKSISK